jgi:phage-related protein
MANTFTWIPSYGADEDHKPKVNTVGYGDGYSQRCADGLNNDLQTRNLNFAGRTDLEADAIIAFLKNEGGVTYFLWMPPGALVAKRWLCSQYKKTQNSFNNNTVTCVFEEVVA